MDDATPFADVLRAVEVIAIPLRDDGRVPNNASLPLLVYPGVIESAALDRRGASLLREIFSANSWTGSWVNGIYSFHHYHSTAHEVLGCTDGSATVQFGGASGVLRTVNAGDVVVIPAGGGHKNCGASADFTVVGAYPPGQSPDRFYGKPGERPRVDENIARVPLPTTDPVFGEAGPLLEHWRQA